MLGIINLVIKNWQLVQPIEALSRTEIFLKASLRDAFKNISGF